MDKKNTLLLTIIAIATLLVAIVGATFAYFSASSNTADTKIEVTTPGKESATFNTNGNLTLNITKEEMQQKGQDVSYNANKDKLTSTVVYSYNAPAETPEAKTTSDFCYSVKVVYNTGGINKVTTHPKDAQLELLVNKAESETGIETSAERIDITGPAVSVTKYISTTKNLVDPETGVPDGCIHKITVPNDGTIKTDYWYFDMIYHNYMGYDQTKDVEGDTTNGHANKTATATFTFKTETCPTATP